MKKLFFFLIIPFFARADEGIDFKLACKMEWVKTHLPDYGRKTPITDEDWRTENAYAAEKYHDENPFNFYYDRKDQWQKTYEKDSEGNQVIHYWDGDKLLWSDHSLGSGSGHFSVTSMSGWVANDRGVVVPGDYSGYQTIISNMKNITIINGSTGAVTFSNNSWYIQNDSNVYFSGLGASHISYGFQFNSVPADAFQPLGNVMDCKFDYISGSNVGGLFFQNSNINLAYDGINSFTKLMVRCKMSFFYLFQCKQMFANFKDWKHNVIDSCDLNHFFVDGSKTSNWITSQSLYRDTVEYTQFNQYTEASPAGDHGMIDIYGTMVIHHCTNIGSNWGWCFGHNFVKSLNTVDDSYIYDNICRGMTSYGLADGREDSAVYYNLSGTPHLNGTSLWIINNTWGNFKNTSNYMTSTVSYGQWSTSNNWRMYVVNNFRYHSPNCCGVNDTAMCINFSPPVGPGVPAIVSSNKYIADPLASNYLTDTISTYAPTSGSPLRNAGNNVKIGMINKDFNNRAWNNSSNPTIGAVEFAVACNSCAFYPRPVYPKN